MKYVNSSRPPNCRTLTLVMDYDAVRHLSGSFDHVTGIDPSLFRTLD